LTVGALADRLSLEPATLSPLLERLESRGMVTRTRDPRDERAPTVALTPRGRQARPRPRASPSR